MIEMVDIDRDRDLQLCKAWCVLCINEQGSQSARQTGVHRQRRRSGGSRLTAEQETEQDGRVRLSTHLGEGSGSSRNSKAVPLGVLRAYCRRSR